LRVEILVHIENFTSPNTSSPSPWCLDTCSILIEDESGVTGYCELKPYDYIQIGTKVKEGNVIANS